MAGDLLTTATPARLLCRRGTWVLELVRLVPVERNVYQPRVERLEGADAILQQLKQSTSDSPALAAAASQLMRAPRTDEERLYDAVDGDWVPGEPGGRPGSTRPSAPPHGTSGELAELRAELLVLRASHERLRERVQRLESQLSKDSLNGDVLAVTPTPAFVMPKPSEAATAPAPFAATLPQGQAPAQNNGLRTPGPMKFPPVTTINACLQTLIGDSCRGREKSPVSFSASERGACWMSRLLDEAGMEVGAIVVDRAATATLGGALLGLPEHEIAAQRSHDAPSVDVISAMSEVANQLCESINQDAAGPHVRTKPIEALAAGLLDWTTSASSALELELADGAGRLFLFAR